MIVRTSVICIHKNKLLGFYAEDSLSKRKYFFPPGGKLEYGESLVDCARRETLEETGYHVLPLQETEHVIIDDFPWEGKIQLKKSHYFLATIQSEQPIEINDAAYHRGYQWLDIDDLEYAFSYSETILNAVKTQVEKHRKMTLLTSTQNIDRAVTNDSPADAKKSTEGILLR